MIFASEKHTRFFARLLSRTFAAMLLLSALPLISLAQPSPGVFGPGPGCNLFPAPASIGTSVPLSYFGPPPSESNPSLAGTVQFCTPCPLLENKVTISSKIYPVYPAYQEPIARTQNLKKVCYI